TFASSSFSSLSKLDDVFRSANFGGGQAHPELTAELNSAKVGGRPFWARTTRRMASVKAFGLSRCCLFWFTMSHICASISLGRPDLVRNGTASLGSNEE